ncbi:pyrroline-5-carboxylate reductase [Leptotrichia sp. oral taxon 847]|uniref:pyrroline-5-carboxylate reductase n=1 Tax=Leptotrichia sp. oral taxon 847 TaxID=1785996 RepID=UPI000768378E|nr:pyrroline-5-carboxylate reductase [Leptotrichia sp. oral taxon 847]AMD95483.1 pyrroline-5-carboxylate reductase [Leptotrichia sp. oral taxon 847]
MKIGFIGTGNMGSSIIKGILSSKFEKNENINIFDLDKDKVNNLVKEYGVNAVNSEKELAENSDIIVLSVKPHIIPVVLKNLSENVKKDTIILTIAAGISISVIENALGEDKKVVRTMPNTPAQVLSGMTAVTFNKNIENSEKEIIFNFLNSFGKSVEIEEKLMHAYTGISGSLPAYVYMFMEALADGGVLCGMPRDKAYKIVAQAVAGSAKMLLETGKHPGQLKDEVCSPAGTTIEAVRVLENGNFRGNVIGAVVACTEKSKEMAGEK